ncbi:hypothetical protein DSECCO2_206310 [anaerobic digester metagenome]
MCDYSLQKEKFKTVLRKSLLFSFMSLLLPLILYFFLRSIANDFMIQSVFKLFCGFFFIYTLIKESLRIYRIRRDWFSFKISITEDAIYKKQYKTEDTIIPINQIVKIVQIADGVSIQSEEANKFLYIPNNIENYEEVLGKLNSLKPIEVSSLMSVRIPSEYTIQQHIKHGSALKRLFLVIGVGFGILILLFLLLIILLS